MKTAKDLQVGDGVLYSDQHRKFQWVEVRIEKVTPSFVWLANIGRVSKEEIDRGWVYKVIQPYSNDIQKN